MQVFRIRLIPGDHYDSREAVAIKYWSLFTYVNEWRSGGDFAGIRLEFLVDVSTSANEPASSRLDFIYLVSLCENSIRAGSLADGANVANDVTHRI